MSHVLDLIGGLGTGKNGRGKSDPAQVLAEARKKLATQKTMSLKFLDQPKPGAEPVNDGRISIADATDYIEDIANRGFVFITDVARPFLRKLDKQIAKVGVEVLDDLTEDGDQLNEERKSNYETGIEFLLAYGVDQDETARDELESFPARRKMWEKLFLRINDAARIALLTDDLRYAEDKDYLEHLLEESKDSSGKKVFVMDVKGKVRAFGVNYSVGEDVFGRYRDFASEKLAEAVSARSRELAVAHKAEVKAQEEEVSTETDNDVPMDEILFGDLTKVNEKSALFFWTYRGHKNALRIRRSGRRLCFESAVGLPNEALENARNELGGEPFVQLSYLLSKNGQHLCPSKANGERVKYDFGGFLKPEIFPLVCWLRTAAGICLPNRLSPDDEQTSDEEEGSAVRRTKPHGKVQPALTDNDGKEVVEPGVFFFRTTNGGAGTIVVNLPEGFSLHLAEVKDEQQEPVAPERDVKLTKATAVRIRRAIVGGQPKIVLDDADNVEVLAELNINGIPGRMWTETGKKGWSGLPDPLPGLLGFRYKQACNAGELKPTTRR